jgi:hypothetical protein
MKHDIFAGIVFGLVVAAITGLFVFIIALILAYRAHASDLNPQGYPCVPGDVDWVCEEGYGCHEVLLDCPRPRYPCGGYAGGGSTPQTESTGWGRGGSSGLAPAGAVSPSTPFSGRTFTGAPHEGHVTGPESFGYWER